MFRIGKMNHIIPFVLINSMNLCISFPLRTRKEEIRSSNLHVLNATNMADVISSNQTQSVSVVWKTDTYAYIYGGLIALFFSTALARSVATFQFCASASQNLHDNMFKKLIATTMGFFYLNPSGRIMNRFSRDMGSADKALPRALLDAAQINLNMIGAIVVTVFVNIKFGAVIMIMLSKHCLLCSLL